MNRRVFRDHRFKLLFAMEFLKEDSDRLVENYFETIREFPIEDDDEDENLYLGKIDPKEDLKKLDKEEYDNLVYLYKIFVKDFSERRDFFDEKIKAHLKNWDIGRLNKADLIILRLALYEIYTKEVNVSIAINEAVMLSKTYSVVDEKSHRFVNALLSEIIKNDESIEK